MSERQPPSKPEPPPTLDPLEVRLPPQAITSLLDAAARRGELPGYRAGNGASLFEITDFGTPFESVLKASALEERGVTRIRWELAVQRRLPVVFLIILIATVWPGVWLTDSMIRTYFSGYDIATWKWYLPLTAPFVPWAMWSAIRKSQVSAHGQAAELVEKVRQVVKSSEQR